MTTTAKKKHTSPTVPPTTNENIAGRIENRLIEATKDTDNPIVIHRYTAQTGSIYLKLDWGAARSVRVADHTGYDHLSYRFNIGTGIPSVYQTVDDGMERWWYPTSAVDELIAEILQQRNELIDQLSPKGYRKRMESSRQKNRNNRFYSHPTTATVIKKGSKKILVPVDFNKEI